MKLRDCSATFFDGGTNIPAAVISTEERRSRRGIGLMFECPLCVREGKSEVERAWIPVHFTNPLDGGPACPSRWKDKEGKDHVSVTWQRSGETLDDLTLSPSINADVHDHGTHRGWHGHVQGGSFVGGGV